jgi:UDP-N-acetylmuramoyl-L-alanine---L-glutamate ligase
MEGAAAVAALRSHVDDVDIVVVQDTAPDVATMGDAPLLAASDPRAQQVLGRCDVVIKSPGVSPYHGAFAEFAARRNREIVVTGGTHLWFAEAASTGALARTIAVTGSKGKSTTSSLAFHLLREAGVDVTLAGNVGRAPIELLSEQLDQQPQGWTVLELSSFQASEVLDSPGIGVLTTLFPEHLDWHETVERYYADKCNLFVQGGCTLAVNATNADALDAALRIRDRCAAVFPFGVPESAYRVDADRRVVCGPGGEQLIALDELRVPGIHNAVNLCGVLTALDAAGFDAPAMAEHASTFEPLAHRLEPLGRHHGRLVIDDGLSTAPEAAVAALAAHPGAGVTILIGGHDRDLDYRSLARALAERQVPTLVLGMPRSGSRILELVSAACASAGNANVVCRMHPDLEAAVADAISETPRSGVILLSPAAPSFGRFANYRERSMRFRELLGPLEPLHARDSA